LRCAVEVGGLGTVAAVSISVKSLDKVSPVSVENGGLGSVPMVKKIPVDNDGVGTDSREDIPSPVPVENEVEAEGGEVILLLKVEVEVNPLLEDDAKKC
jgi:hypothetical protein